LLACARDGSLEILGALDGAPVLVVELAEGEDVAEAIPAWLPCVVVGVAVEPATLPAPAGVDVGLCPEGGGAAPSGWVAVPDPPAESDRLVTQISGSPQPAVVLAQLLRASSKLDVEAALLAESLAYSTLQAGPAFAAWLRGRRPVQAESRAEPDDPVLVERVGDHLVVTLNRPHVRNAVDVRMRDALSEALSIACADASITAVELRGSGPAFSSGGDLDEFGTLPDPSTAHLTRTARSPARLLAVLGPRVTAYVHGACVGAGIELAAFAGKVLATPDTRCQLPEVPLGLVPGSGGTVSVARRIGRHRAAWLGLGAATVEVATAREWGLVDAVEEAH